MKYFPYSSTNFEKCLMCTEGCGNLCIFCTKEITTTVKILEMGDVPGFALKLEEIIPSLPRVEDIEGMNRNLDIHISRENELDQHQEAGHFEFDQQMATVGFLNQSQLLLYLPNQEKIQTTWKLIFLDDK